jgi:hypothetical protein
MPDRIISEQWLEIITGSYGETLAEPVPAQLGNPTTGQVGVPPGTADIPGQVYIHGIGDDARSIGTAINAGAVQNKDLIFGAPVLIKLKNKRWVIEGLDPYRANEYFAGVARTSQLPVSAAQFNWGLLQQTSPVASMRAQLSEAVYTQDNTLYAVADQYTADFSASPLDTLAAAINVPTTNLRAIAVLVQIDVTTGALSYKQGAEFDAELTHLQAFNAGYYPQRDSLRFAAGYVKLIAGMTAILSRHIYVTSELLTSGGSTAPALYLQNRTLSANFTITGGYSNVIAGDFTIASGITLTLASNGIMLIL